MPCPHLAPAHSVRAQTSEKEDDMRTYLNWKHFSRVAERHRTHAWRVEALVQVHSRGDHGSASCAVGGAVAFGVCGADEERHAGPEKGDAQEGEGDEQEKATAECVDGEEGWQREYPI